MGHNHLLPHMPVFLVSGSHVWIQSQHFVAGRKSMLAFKLSQPESMMSNTAVHYKLCLNVISIDRTGFPLQIVCFLDATKYCQPDLQHRQEVQ